MRLFGGKGNKFIRGDIKLQGYGRQYVFNKGFQFLVDVDLLVRDEDVCNYGNSGSFKGGECRKKIVKN